MLKETEKELKPEMSSKNSLKEELTTQLAWASEMSGYKNTSTKELAERLKALADVTKRLKFEYDLLEQTKPDRSILHLYRVWCPETDTSTTTTDAPLYPGDSLEGHRHLQGYLVVSDLEVYLERQKSAAFIVFWDYDCGFSQTIGAAARKARDRIEMSTEDSLLQRTVRILSDDLSNTMNNLTEDHPGAKEIFPVFDTLTELPAPYLFYYHNKAFFQTIMATSPDDSEQSLFLQHIHNSMAEEYQKVDALFDEGLITAKFIHICLLQRPRLSRTGMGKRKFTVKKHSFPEVIGMRTTTQR